MDISIISVFPELYEPFLSTSLIKKAQEKKIVNLHLDSFFSYVMPKERIDAPTFGPGSGMLIKPEVIEKAVQAHKQAYGPSFNVFFSPQGTLLDQSLLKKLAAILQERKHMLLLPMRYEGVDARVQTSYEDISISIGNYVLMGGDVPAMVLLEGMLRYIPGIVGKEDSIEQDSFSGPFVDYPAYTEPVEWQGMKVPDIVRSGNHQAIEQWRRGQAAKTSVTHHFEWVQEHVQKDVDKQLAASYIPPHYVALCHSQVLIGEQKVIGTTSVTSIDIHDIARSCATYGIKQYMIVTPLKDQQKIVQRFLDFWASEVGSSYNAQRQGAIASVKLVESISQTMDMIEQQEGKRPLLVATSARKVDHEKAITFFDQDKVWQQERPILLLFGTGKGLSAEVISMCDYLLDPIEGFSKFNHLSVRSAAAIVLDRWLGIHSRKI